MAGHKLLAVGSMAAVAVMWGSIPLIVRDDIPVSHLVAARVWLGALALLIYLAVRGRIRVPQRHRARLVAAGILVSLHWAAFFAAIKATSVAVALTVVFLGPIAASSLAPRLLGERFHLPAYAGLGVGFVGVLLVARPGGGAVLSGVAWATAAAVGAAALLIVAKPAAEDLGGLTVASAELVVASIVLSPWMVRTVVESREFALEFMVLGVLMTGVGFVVFWTAMSQLQVAVVSVLLFLEPASAAVWAALFLDEVPDALAWVGIGLVVAGGGLAALYQARRELGQVVPSAS